LKTTAGMPFDGLEIDKGGAGADLRIRFQRIAFTSRTAHERKLLSANFGDRNRFKESELPATVIVQIYGCNY